MISHHAQAIFHQSTQKYFGFLKVVESCIEQIRKPNPEIYRRTLEKLNVKPEDAIFLDDFGQNLKPAKELGIHTIKVGFVQCFSAIFYVICLFYLFIFS